ncbi:D-alanyl-D-alanine carboxypeptidase/D-alanyl-D-alanine endopeptidase [Streptomyces abyssomicinicus]|uniref:D-alanyl-D-alanine carboxypeptidase/D-alanyl-D-alanine endopeptidase n=1 Tax=Streptomyces abyssomicinicus TaxID=574929 RepID=UPI001FE6D432|nr:D-alanyl-D-alanine carboxypeptidase/D-alanyl-D-alanine-endopeptidase [Streptomyces abyssomicinicus]
MARWSDPVGRYTVCAAVSGALLAAGVVTAAGPWDSSGQRTAERAHAVALGGEHPAPGSVGTGSGGPAGAGGDTGREPGTAPAAVAVLAGLGAVPDGHEAGGAGSAAGAPTTAGLERVLGPLLDDPALGSRRSAAVVDVATGRTLFERGAGTALLPASTTKIATGVAALSAMGPDHRFTTRTVLQPDGAAAKGAGEGERRDGDKGKAVRELVLVGGGDPTLTAREKPGRWASLRELAALTAAALRRQGVEEVVLRYDTSLFKGPEVHPIGVNPNISPVTALMVDEGRADDSDHGPAPRVADPAAHTAGVFADLLEKRGIRAGAPAPGKAAKKADPVAQVRSAPLAAQVERMMTNSDNDIAEALARQTAVADGREASFAGGGTAIRAELKRLGVPLAGVRFADGSGLGRGDRLSARALTRLLTTAADPGRPELRPVLTGMPVAGFSGTLSARAADGGAAGVVRAKTGTLTGVNTLAGTAVDAGGRLLAFAFLAEGTPAKVPAETALDRLAASVAACGCRG